MKKKNNFFYDFIIFILILHISQSSILNVREIPFLIGLLLLWVYFSKGRVFSRDFVIITLIWVAINLSAVLLLSISLPYIRIIIHTVNLLFLPYILLSLLGMQFWVRFERIVYYLTLISLPLFAINVITPGLFNNLWQTFRPITSESFGVAYPYWTSFIYVNAMLDESSNLIRNAGFMWEPGAFALILIWAIIYNLCRNSNKIDKKVLIYSLALATTFSTAGYLAIAFIVIAVYIRKYTFLNVLVLSILMIVYFTYVFQLGFVSEKLDTYITNFKNEDITYAKKQETIKLNRFSGGYAALLQTLKLPIGYGLTSNEDTKGETLQIYGTNGLGSLLVMWGFPMFIYLLILTRRYLIWISPEKKKALQINLFLLALLIMFFSNPISRSIFVYFIFFTPLVLPRMEKINIYSKCLIEE